MLILVGVTGQWYILLITMRKRPHVITVVAVMRFTHASAIIHGPQIKKQCFAYWFTTVIVTKIMGTKLHVLYLLLCGRDNSHWHECQRTCVKDVVWYTVCKQGLT